MAGFTQKQSIVLCFSSIPCLLSLLLLNTFTKLATLGQQSLYWAGAVSWADQPEQPPVQLPARRPQ